MPAAAARLRYIRKPESWPSAKRSSAWSELAIGLKNDTARNTQQGRQNHPTGSPNVGRQLQDTETGYGRKVAIIRKKSCAADCQCRYNLQRIRRLDSRCGS
jgi:hypothetical protein